MELINVYQEFIKENDVYMDFVMQLVDTDFMMIIPEVIKSELVSGKEKFEKLMESVNALEVEKEQEENLGDLKYLIMDSVLLASDLAHFYKLNELGRFKMRALNAINKKRRAEVFKEEASESRSCPIGLI